MKRAQPVAKGDESIEQPTYSNISEKTRVLDNFCVFAMNFDEQLTYLLFTLFDGQQRRILFALLP